MLKENVFAYRSFNPELETVKQFSDFGVNWVCIYPSNTLNSLGLPYSVYGPTWLGMDEYDFGPLDLEIEELVAASPDVQIICMIDLNTPPWLERRLGRGLGGHDTFHNLGKMASLPQWREATRDYLQAFLRHVEANFSASIGAYMLSCGGTCEWQECSYGEESKSRRTAFREWAMALDMPDPIDIPPASVRDHISHDLLRDPEADAMALAYWRFCNWQIGDTILYFARAAQEVIDHRAELGSFYGYILTFGQNRLVSEGHLDYERVFASPDLDFFVAPGSYETRQIGGTSPFLSPVGSMKLRGKGFIQENDQRTHTSNPPAEWYTCAFNIWKNETETIVGLRREFSFCLTEDVSFWWFDMWGGFYEGENVLNALAHMKQIWNNAQARGDSSVAEIALVMDPESALYMDQNDPRVNGFTRMFGQLLTRIGAPHRTYSFGDLPDLDLSPYKLVIFPNLFVVNNERRRVLTQNVFRDDRTVLWFYRPGVIADGRYHESAMRELCGVDIDEPGIQIRNMDGWTSVVSPTPEVEPCELRTIARAAGVHIYGDTDEPVYVSEHYVALHTARGGKRRIALPRTCATVTELFGGRVVARDTDVIEDRLEAPATVLYELR